MMKHFLYFFLALFSLNLFSQTVLAQQAEIAVSSKVDIKTFSEKEIKQYQLNSSNSRTSAIIKKEDAVKRLFRDQIKNSYNEILQRLGQNQNVRFVKEYNPATTNFILRINFSIMIDEVPMDVSVEGQKRKDGGGYNHGIYYLRVIFQLDDPHTNEIVTMFPMYQTKFWSNNYLSPEYLFNEFWLSFLKIAIPRANADALSKLIKERISYHNANISYQPDNNEKPKADGKQGGYVTVKVSEVLGEARQNSITRFVLKCEKGTFPETNAKEIEFTGADYYYEKHGGVKKFKTKYKAYNCKNFSKEEREFDNFSLIQKQALSETLEHTVAEKKIKFACEKKYNIYAYYNAPGFVKAGMVWRNSTILFPEEGEEPQVFDVMAYEKAGGQGEPKGTDGKTLQIPYSMTMPMIGKQTFYGHGGNGEYETPEVLYIKSLGAIPAFRLNKKYDALNSCHIVSTKGGTPHLELSIDLSAGSDGKYPEQFRIYCNNTLARANLPAFPINFKVITFTKEDIDQFKKFEKVEKTVSNGKATLKVVFEPEKIKE